MPSTVTLTALGATQPFSAEARDLNDNVVAGEAFTWFSSSAAVATIDGNGLATAVTNGSTTITADNAAAIDDLEKAMAKNPGNAYAHYYAGVAYNGLKRTDKMVEHFQHFLRLAPRAPEAKKIQSVLRAVG